MASRVTGDRSGMKPCLQRRWYDNKSGDVKVDSGWQLMIGRTQQVNRCEEASKTILYTFHNVGLGGTLSFISGLLRSLDLRACLAFR